MIEKSIDKEYGTVNSSAEIFYTDNGQAVIHITSTLGEARHEHRITVGSEDGRDMVGSLSEDELKASLQKHLDEKRQQAADILNGRAKVAKVALGLN
jgi:hypothetical protein